jgi:hypothetical protein
MRFMSLTVLLALTVLTSAGPLRAQSDDERYIIMKPEPWLGPKYKSPRGTRQQVEPVQPLPGPEPPVAAPPPIFVPETGRLLPNLPAIAPAGPGGRETYQDRATRCHHQAGSYGAAAGDRNAYIGACINQ